MKAAIFSDIHGNYRAFEAVMAQINILGIDAIYCLGDLVSGGAGGDAVITLLKARGVQCLLGNHDQFMLKPEHGLFPVWAEAYVYDLLEWERKNLGESTWTFLETLPETIDMTFDDGTKVLLCHATPLSRWVLEPLGLGADEEELVRHYGTTEASLIVHGHDHLGTGIRCWRDKKILNVTSVGGGEKGLANFSIIESGLQQYRITQHQVYYDWKAEQDQMVKAAVPMIEDYR